MDLEQAADELYGADLDEFVKMRTRLAKELREAGNRAEADTLAKLRKPSVEAYQSSLVDVFPNGYGAFRFRIAIDNVNRRWVDVDYVSE